MASKQQSGASTTTLLVVGGVVLVVLAVGGLAAAWLFRSAQAGAAVATGDAGGSDSLPPAPVPRLAPWRPPAMPSHTGRVPVPEWGVPVTVVTAARPAHQHAWLVEDVGATGLADVGSACSRGPVSLLFSPDADGVARLVLEIPSRQLTCHGVLRARQLDVAALEPARAALVVWRNALVARHPELEPLEVGLYVSDDRGGVQLWDEVGGFSDCIVVDGEPVCFGDAPRTLFPMEPGMLQGRALSVLGG